MSAPSGTVIDPTELGFGEDDHVEEVEKAPVAKEIPPKKEGEVEGEVEKEPTPMEKAVAELASTQKTILEKVNKKEEAPPEKMTPEQEAEFWGIYDPEKTNKEFFKQWFRLNPDATEEEVKAAKDLFSDAQKGLVNQSMKGARNYTDYQLAKLQEELKPIREYMTRQEQRATRERFFGQYPTLKDKKFQKILSIAATELGGKEHSDESTYFKALADRAAEAIKELVPEFDLGKTTTTPSKTPKLPRTSAGGGGGAGKGQSSAVAHVEDQSESIFTDD